MGGPDPPSGKDFWDKVEILIRPIGALVSAGVIGLIGYLGSNLVERQQNIEANVRLYSELMSRREEAESLLRKDMLTSVIDSFLKPAEGEENFEKEILHLELLAQNFHESLNITPLFGSLEKRITESALNDKDYYLRRLERVAREVTRKQLVTLLGVGESFDYEAGLAPDSTRFRVLGDPPPEWQPMELDGVRRDFKITPIAVNKDLRPQLRVRLETREKAGDGWHFTDEEFQIGYFDFPLVDNTRMTHDQRSAVVLTNFQKSVDGDPGQRWQEAAELNYRGHLNNRAHQRWQTHVDTTSCEAVDSLEQLGQALLRDEESATHQQAVAHRDGDDVDVVKSHAAWKWHRRSAEHLVSDDHYYSREHQQYRGHLESEEHGKAMEHPATHGFMVSQEHRAGVVHQQTVFHLESDEHLATVIHETDEAHLDWGRHAATEEHRWFEQHGQLPVHLDAEDHFDGDPDHLDAEKLIHLESGEHQEAEAHAGSDQHVRFVAQQASPLAMANVRVVLFPGSYGSLQEKRYYEDIIKQLRDTGLYGDEE